MVTITVYKADGSVDVYNDCTNIAYDAATRTLTFHGKLSGASKALDWTLVLAEGWKWSKESA